MSDMNMSERPKENRFLAKVKKDREDDLPRVLVVDDDSGMLHLIRSVLTSDYKVFLANSGKNAVSFMESREVDLILLDIRMPDMDGFETIGEIRKIEGRDKIPVVFLTANEDEDSEIQGLAAGGADFIRKPFVPEVLRLRVGNVVELDHLRRELQDEVDKKTEELRAEKQKTEQMAVQIVTTLSGAIDAKDTYTNGHSMRVAKYSAEIARRYGYSPTEVKDVYIAGLLHDVGKIGIPDAIINKPTKLTDQEYGVIKTHPSIGSEILKSVTSLPNIAVGAHWHHERYDGKGYPDGLKGNEIPEIARIIGVADAYDTMASNRSYRKVLPQEVVRGEIEKGKGTQFSPEFADIMLQMIDEDTQYDMREK